MADDVFLRKLKEGVTAWNKWRPSDPKFRADLTGADLKGADLKGADLKGANLSGANLSGANLSGADLRSADLSGADLTGADLTGAKLPGANLMRANLSHADLKGADLTGADLSGAVLSGANLTSASLGDAVFTGARVNSETQGLDELSNDQRDGLVHLDSDPDAGGRGNLVLRPFELAGGESAADESNWAMHDLAPGKTVGVGMGTHPDAGTSTSREPQPEPVIAEHTREVLIAKTEELSRLFREHWEKASLSQDELTTVATHLEAVRQLLIAPAPEIRIVIQVLQAVAKIIKKMPDLVTYFLGVITEINLVIGELEKLGVDVTALRELIKQLLSNFD